MACTGTCNEHSGYNPASRAQLPAQCSTTHTRANPHAHNPKPPGPCPRHVTSAATSPRPCRAARNHNHFHKLLHKRMHAILDATSPTKSVMIAVDGPAPLAKLLTQRERRKVGPVCVCVGGKRGRGAGVRGRSRRCSTLSTSAEAGVWAAQAAHGALPPIALVCALGACVLLPPADASCYCRACCCRACRRRAALWTRVRR